RATDGIRAVSRILSGAVGTGVHFAGISLVVRSSHHMHSNICPTRRALAATILGLCAGLSLVAPAEAQAPLPAGWPSRVELGMADSPGGAAAMKQTAPFAFRYQYLAGGVNTGSGWANWNTNS